jgi:hypothetical protein
MLAPNQFSDINLSHILWSTLGTGVGVRYGTSCERRSRGAQDDQGAGKDQRLKFSLCHIECLISIKRTQHKIIIKLTA